MATINSNGTGGGNWSSTSSWSGGVVPVEGDKVNIVSGDTITVDGTYTSGDDTTTAINVKDGGVLKASRTANSELVVKGDLQIENNGELDYGKTGDIIPSSYTAKLRLNYSATLTDGLYGLLVNYGGKCFVHGSERTTNSNTSTDITAGDNSVDIDDVTGWVAGDVVVVGSTYDGNSAQSEENTISSISGNTVTFVNTFYYSHSKGIICSNLTKNVVFEAYDQNYPAYFELRTSTGIPNGDNEREVQQLSLRYMGDTAHPYKYGAICLMGSNSGMENLYVALSDIAVYKGDFAAFEGFASKPNQYNFKNCAGFLTGTGTYCLSGGSLKFDNLCIYNAGNGVLASYSEGGVNVEFNDCWFTGCNYGLSNNAGSWHTFNRCKFTSGYRVIRLGSGSPAIFNDCYLGVDDADMTSRYNYMTDMLTNANMEVYFNNCYINQKDGFMLSRANANEKMKVYVNNKDVDPSSQEIYSLAGTLYRDNTTYKTGSASLRAELEATTHILSNTWQIFAPTGELVVVSGYLRKNSSYGSSTRPKVTLSGLGITESTYTMTDVDDTWEQFTVSGTQTTGTDGILTLKVEFQSSNSGAKAWIDGIVAPPAVAVNSGDFGYWSGGAPAELIASNFTSANDVWNKLTSDITLTGSIGKQLKENVDDKISNIASNVWSYTTRTLSSFGSLVTDIWNYATRILTAGTRDSEIDSIKSKTDNLPTDPSSQSDTENYIDLMETNIRGTDNDNLKDISDQIDNINIDNNAIADAVWDEVLSDHQSSGSTGNKLSNASLGGVGGSFELDAKAIRKEFERLVKGLKKELQVIKDEVKKDIIVSIPEHKIDIDPILKNISILENKLDNINDKEYPVTDTKPILDSIANTEKLIKGLDLDPEKTNISKIINFLETIRKSYKSNSNKIITAIKKNRTTIIKNKFNKAELNDLKNLQDRIREEILFEINDVSKANNKEIDSLIDKKLNNILIEFNKGNKKIDDIIKVKDDKDKKRIRDMLIKLSTIILLQDDPKININIKKKQ